MDYLKSLSWKEWLALFAAFILFVAGYFWWRSRAVVKVGPDLNALKSQTAPRTVNQNLNSSEIQNLQNQGRVAPVASQPKNSMTTDQQNALLKLMSATRK